MPAALVRVAARELLVAVHFGVAFGQQLGDGLVAPRVEIDLADAEADIVAALVGRVARGDHAAQALHRRDGFGFAGVDQHGDEFVAAQPGYQVAAAEDYAQRFSEAETIAAVE